MANSNPDNSTKPSGFSFMGIVILFFLILLSPLIILFLIYYYLYYLALVIKRKLRAAPTLKTPRQFKSYCRDRFSFLPDLYGFRESPRPAHHTGVRYEELFLVRFASSRIFLEISSCRHGNGLSVTMGELTAGHSIQRLFAVEDILSYLDPANERAHKYVYGKHKKPLLDRIDYYASTLEAHGKEIFSPAFFLENADKLPELLHKDSLHKEILAN